MNTLKPYYSDDVRQYMELNGFVRIGSEIWPNHMQFLKGDLAITFRDRKITVSNGAHEKIFIGFDGKDMFQLMMLLHLMGGVDLKDVKGEVLNEHAFHSMGKHLAEAV